MLDNDNDKVKTITYKPKFMDSYKFMKDSLSNLVDNLSEINNKKEADYARSMTASLVKSIDDYRAM